jgi:hypothetical protein
VVYTLNNKSLCPSLEGRGAEAGKRFIDNPELEFLKSLWGLETKEE